MVELIVTGIVFALIAWICAYISRPLFSTKWARILSQVIASFLLFVSYILAK